MKRAVALGISFLVGGCALLAQSTTDQIEAPKQVLEQFVKADLEGVRLRTDGWYKTARFFLRPGLLPRGKNIFVVSDNYELKAGAISPNKVEFQLFFLVFYGRLDSRLRFEETPDRAPNGPLIISGLSDQYNLVLTDKHWELSADGQEAKEVTGSLEWRIERFEPALGVSLRTAIRYVTEMRDKTNDPVIRKNAARTLVTLRRYR